MEKKTLGETRLQKSQIVQRTHLVPVVFCRWASRWRGLHWGCLCGTSSCPGLHWHGACCIVGNNIPCSVLRCIHQISANVWEFHAYRKWMYYSQYTRCILKYSRSCMVVCHFEHSLCTDSSVLKLYLVDSGKYSRSSGYSMHTESFRTKHSRAGRNIYIFIQIKKLISRYFLNFYDIRYISMFAFAFK